MVTIHGMYPNYEKYSYYNSANTSNGIYALVNEGTQVFQEKFSKEVLQFRNQYNKSKVLFKLIDETEDNKTEISYFKSLMKGEIIINDKKYSVKKKSSSEEHRPGVDMTITPSKSISALLLLPGYRNLVLDAHHYAVQEALKYFSEYIRARRKLTAKETDTMFFAQFTHFASRNNDINLHTHLVLFNILLDVERKARAVDYSSLYPIIDINYVYNKALYEFMSKNAPTLNFTFDEKGNLHCVNVNQEVVKLLSSRSKEIVDFLKKENIVATDKGIDVVAVATRKEKTENITLDAAIKHSLEVLKNNKCDKILESLVTPIEKNYLYTEQDVIEDFYGFLRRNKCNSFTELTIERYLDSRNIQNKDFVRNKILSYHNDFSYKKPSDVRNFFVNKKGFEKVHFTVSKLIRFQSENKKLIKFDINQDFFKNLNDEQKNMIKSIQNNYITFVQAPGGTGKTFSLQSFEEENIVGVALTGKAATLIPAKNVMTLHTLLGITPDDEININEEKNRIYSIRNKILVIDECSMLDEHMFELICKVIERGNPARVVFLGDYHQIEPLEGTAAFNLLCRSMKQRVVTLSDIKRQEDPELRNVCKVLVSEYSDRSVFTAIEYLENHSEPLDSLDVNQLCNYIQNGYQILCNNNNIVDKINNILYAKALRGELSRRVPIVCTENNWKYGVLNGMRGFLDIDDGNVYFDDHCFSEEDCPIEYMPAYCMTVMKSQGSSYDRVVYIHQSHDEVNTIYTAITRARKEIKVLTNDFDNLAFNIAEERYSKSVDSFIQAENELKFFMKEKEKIKPEPEKPKPEPEKPKKEKGFGFGM